MKSQDCTKWESCSAALCPLDKKHLESEIWYPDDGICSKHCSGWIQNQKKIAKKTKDVDKYFTYEMLKVNCVLGKGITGLDPDKPEAPQLKKWLDNHPPKKELTKVQKKIIADRFRKYREKQNKNKGGLV